MEKMKRILIGGQTYPYKIDLNVLEAIQDKYGSISQFERELVGIRFREDDDGNQIYSEEGQPVMYKVEPSIRAIKAVLSTAINEGIAIEAENSGKEYVPMAEEDIFRNCTISYDLLARMLYDEFMRCFETKK